MRTCAFCQRPENEVKRLVGSPGGPAICNKCIAEAAEAVSGDASKDAPKKKTEEPVRSPREVKAFLDQYVIDQEKAKEDIAVAVYKHYRRREATRLGLTMADELAKVEIQKSNILLLGPSGTGKTEIGRSIAKMLGVPFYIGDATKITQAGYVGDSVETLLQGLLAAASGDVQRAEWGVILLDEMDKLARKSGRGASGYRDVSGEGVQQSLLKLIEGSQVSVPRNGLPMDGGQGSDLIDTSNILFICAGSFAGIEELIRRRINKKASLGFGAETRKDVSLEEVYTQVREEDILDFGIIPELLGRLPVLTSTLPLSEDALVRVLTEPKNALVKQFRALYAMDKIDLQFDVEALKAIGREANRRPTGARALRSILEEILRPYSFRFLGDRDVKAIRITKDAVEGKGEAMIVTESGQPLSLKAATA